MSIQLPDGFDRPSKGDGHIGRWLSVELNHAENHLVAGLRFFQSKHTNAGIVQMNQGKALAQRARMFRGFEGNERIAETIGLPVRLRLTPSIRVPGQAEDEFMMTPVLVGLIAVPLRTSIRLGARMPGERRRVSRIVLSLGLSEPFLQSVKEGGPKAAALVGEIDPAMRRDFELPLLRIRPLDGAEVPVVSGIFD